MIARAFYAFTKGLVLDWATTHVFGSEQLLSSMQEDTGHGGLDLKWILAATQELLAAFFDIYQ